MPDAQSIEREIENDRAELDRNLTRLNERFKPDRNGGSGAPADGAPTDLMDQVCAYLDGNSRRMPLALALASTGLCWYLDQRKNPGSRTTLTGTNNAAGLYDKPKSHQETPDLDDLADSTMDEVHRQAEALRAKIEEGTQDLPEEARKRVMEAREKAIQTLERTKGEVRHGARQTSDFIQEHPMAVGGAALAFGAAVAGILFARHRQSDDSVSTDAFAHADRVLEDELEKAGVKEHDTVLAHINDS